VTPAKRGAVGYSATACRLVDRLPLRQRLSEGEPSVLVPQARQQRGGQCVETLAAGFAPIPSQPTGDPTILRARRLAVRTLPVHANGQFDRRSRPLVRVTRHNRHGVSTLRLRKIIHLADPSQKRLPIHGHNSSISARISQPQRNATRAKKITELRRRNRDDAVGNRGPQEPPALQPFVTQLGMQTFLPLRRSLSG
jgi:hypothetical protein